MKWPWQRELTEAHKEAQDARSERVEAAVRLREVEQQMTESLKTVTKLRQHLETNGWTELLEQAWSGK